VVEDAGTGDPTLFAADPDVTGSWSLIVPALVHLDGEDGSRFRTDLFIGNSSGSPVTLFLSAESWQKNSDVVFAEVEIPPNETRRFEDVLLSLFETTGIANRDLSHVGGVRAFLRGLRIMTALRARRGGGTWNVIPQSHRRARDARFSRSSVRFVGPGPCGLSIVGLSTFTRGRAAPSNPQMSGDSRSISSTSSFGPTVASRFRTSWERETWIRGAAPSW
jgi:hypothetical protein